ncbi:unnamed protein product [Symbiodinium sp. CCMP2592]|nr:unnamed protein product [Symbiodinium sp. CCMP2592]
MTPADLVCGMDTGGCKEGLQKCFDTQAQAEQPENDPPGELEGDPVPRKDEETAAECIRLQNILDRMKQLMREERAVWNEERAQLLDELSATRRALSASEAAREAAELALAQRRSACGAGRDVPGQETFGAFSRRIQSIQQAIAPCWPMDQNADDAALANELDFSFEERADLLADLLEADDSSVLPLLECPPEVLSSVLLLSALCRQTGGGDNGSDETTVPDDACKPLRFRVIALHIILVLPVSVLAVPLPSADARRLEWDPLMICAPPALRYSLLAAMQVRRQLWTQHGPSLGAGWDWFSAKVCRRMAVPTFLRWASLQHDGKALQALLRPLGLSTGDAVSSGAVLPGQKRKRANDADEEAEPAKRIGMRFRCGRSDAVDLSEEAVNDIYETVQRWHSKEHREMMRAHFQGTDTSKKGKTQLPRGNSGVFSVTPTLDAHEATVFALNESQPEPDTAKKPQAEGRGAASINIEEAQLRLAVELSKREAEQPEKEKAQETQKDPQSKAQAVPEEIQAEAVPEKTQDAADVRVPEFEGLPLRGEGGVPAAQVFVKPHCLAARVEALPDALERSIESIVHKLVTPGSWALLYESITEELCLRARCAAHALCASHAGAMDQLEDVATDTAKLQGSSTGISLDQERLCLPIWRRSSVMTGLGLSCLTESARGFSAEKLRLDRARHDFLKHAMLEWCELEDLTEFLDAQLGPLEMAIDNFRGSQEVNGGAHTPHVRDIGRLMFRNHCLLDSRVFRPLCLAAYALVHEARVASGEKRDPDSVDALVDLLEHFHGMLVGCDVADDHLSSSKNTKEFRVRCG